MLIQAQVEVAQLSHRPCFLSHDLLCSYGRCVNLTAVGLDSVLASYRASTSYTTMSGTSFSSPLVAGVAASIWSGMPAGTTARQVAQTLVSRATYGMLPVAAPYSTTINALAYSLPNGNADLSLSPMPTATPSPTGIGSLAPGTCPISFISASGITGTIQPSASSVDVGATGGCATGSPMRTGTKIVFRIDLGAGTMLGGNLTVSTCGQSSGDTLIYVGRGEIFHFPGRFLPSVHHRAPKVLSFGLATVITFCRMPCHRRPLRL